MKLLTARFFVVGHLKPFLIDRWLLKHVVRHKWSYVERTGTLRATVEPGQPRVFLHQFICKLTHRNWAETYFANGDTHDCRLVNLKPYNRLLQAMLRRKGKNNNSGHPGVSFKIATRRWAATVRHKGKLHHIGYFPTANLAGKAYRQAFEQLKHIKFNNRKIRAKA